MTDDALDFELRFKVLDQELGKLRGDLETVKRFNSEAARGFENTAKRAKEAESSVSGFSLSAVGGLRGVAAAAIGVSGGIAGAVAGIHMTRRAFDEASAMAAEFQTRMLEISTISDLSAGQMVALSGRLQDLTVRFGQVDTVMAKAQYDVMSSGFSNVADSVSILDVASRAAIGGVTDVATAAKLLTQIINAYGMEAKDSEQIADMLFATVRDGVTTFEELAANLGNATSTAATAGIDFAELAAAIAVMTKKGINTAESVTALNGLILAIGAASGESKNKLVELGISLDAGLTPALAAVNAASGSNIGTLRELIPEMRALKAAAAAGAEGAAELNAELLRIKDSGGQADAAYVKMAQGKEHSDARMKAANERLKQSFGGVFLNERAAVARTNAEAVNDMAGAVEDLSSAMSPFRDMNMSFSVPEQMGRFDAAAVAGPIEEAIVYTERYRNSLREIDRASDAFYVKAPEKVKQLTEAEQKAAEVVAQTADRLRSLGPIASELGVSLKELRINMSGEIAWVNRTPEELVGDINRTLQYAYEASQQTMIIKPKVQPEMQGPLLGMSPEEIKEANKRADELASHGTRALTGLEAAAVDLGGALQSSLVNALMDGKAKLIDLGAIGRSVLNSLVGGLISLGLNAIAPGLGGVGIFDTLFKKKALGGPIGPGLNVVGEYGPELLLTGGSGRVIPSNDTAKIMRGGGSGMNIDARTTINFPASGTYFIDSPASMRRLAEMVTREQETKIARTYRRRSHG